MKKLSNIFQGPEQLAQRLCDAAWDGEEAELAQMLEEEKYRKVLNIANYGGKTALYCAAYKGNLRILITLIEAGAYVNCISSDKNTPLHGMSPNSFFFLKCTGSQLARTL